MPKHKLKHLPEELWPPDDRLLFEAAFAPGDIFDDSRGPGAHLSEATRTYLRFALRRWLGFLAEHHPGELYMEPAERIRPVQLRRYVEHLSTTNSANSVAIQIARLYDCARLLFPDQGWTWLRRLKSRLQARGRPQDRFERLASPAQTLDLGFRLMDEAPAMDPDPWHLREIQYRDGLILAVLTLWPIRRRSLAALTVKKHLTFQGSGAELRLFPEDTKSKRAESWAVPEQLLPYIKTYLEVIRPALLRGDDCGAFWISQRGQRLLPAALYDVVCKRTDDHFGQPMALHDFRRSAPTFLAMEAPEKIGLTPGILQHTSPDVGGRHYNLARTMKASQRHVRAVSAMKDRLRTAKNDR